MKNYNKTVLSIVLSLGLVSVPAQAMMNPIRVIQGAAAASLAWIMLHQKEEGSRDSVVSPQEIMRDPDLERRVNEDIKKGVPRIMAGTDMLRKADEYVEKRREEYREEFRRLSEIRMQEIEKKEKELLADLPKMSK